MTNPPIVKTKDGIQWYIEQQGSGPHLILIPSGEGDCGSFAKTAAILAQDFTVTTFDMPGMSRTVAPTSAVKDVTGPILAKQIVGLLDELKIKVATFYGCSKHGELFDLTFLRRPIMVYPTYISYSSKLPRPNVSSSFTPKRVLTKIRLTHPGSAGAATLSLVAFHPERVQSAIVHEVPLHTPPVLAKLAELDDEDIIKLCQHRFESDFIEDMGAWNGLGPEYLARLDKNYPTWIRGYTTKLTDLKLSNEELTRKPITWTIGALSAAGMFFDNVVRATKAGIEVGLLNSKHFPQVTIPRDLAEHIKGAALKHL